MKPRTLLVLFVVVAALGAFIWFYERELPSSQERAELAKKVLRLEADEVEAVELEWQGRTLRLERQRPPEKQEPASTAAAEGETGEAEEADDALAELSEESTWRIARPLFSGQPARADGAEVSRLLDALFALEKTRTLDDFDPKQVGLDKPRGKVKLETEDGERVLAIGAAVPTGAKMIVGLGDEEAYVVDDALLLDLEREAGAWRDKEVFPGERADIQRITLRGGEGGPVVLALQGEAFRVQRPFADRADRDLVDSLLTDLVGLRAERFLDQSDGAAAPGALGLAPPQRVIEVAFAGGTPPARIELGRTDEATGLTAARVGRQLFEARTGLVEATGNPPAAWRSPAWSGLEVFEIDRARFADAAGAVEVVRADADWKRGNDLISFTTVSDVLFVLTGAKAETLLTPEEARARGIDLTKPALTITLNGGAPPKGETLTLYAPTNSGVPARATGRDVVLLLPAEQAGDVRTRLADLRKAKPLPPEEKRNAGDEEE